MWWHILGFYLGCVGRLEFTILQTWSCGRFALLEIHWPRGSKFHAQVHAEPRRLGYGTTQEVHPEFSGGPSFVILTNQKITWEEHVLQLQKRFCWWCLSKWVSDQEVPKKISTPSARGTVKNETKMASCRGTAAWPGFPKIEPREKRHKKKKRNWPGFSVLCMCFHQIVFLQLATTAWPRPEFHHPKWK